MAKKPVVRFTANFERNLDDIEHFLIANDATQAYDRLLGALLEMAIPNLAHFPEIGRPFLAREARSAEATHALASLGKKLMGLTPDTHALREYVFDDYLLLYANIGDAIYLLAIRHHRQLSFDLQKHWSP